MTTAIILAAGKGTRMYSELPKVLHKVAGRPMVKHVIDTCIQAQINSIYLVYGFKGALLQQELQTEQINWVEQTQQLGTAHAVQQVMPHLLDIDDDVLIVYGDNPLLSADTVTQLIAIKPEGGIALLTAELQDPTGYGRIIRSHIHNNIIDIVEQKDASKPQLKITEINTGVLVVNSHDLAYWLSLITNDNAQNEFYLTDLIKIATAHGQTVISMHPSSLYEIEGANNRLQLAKLERLYQQQQAERLMLQGVTLLDPNRFDLRGSLQCGKDVIIDINVIIEGHVTIGDNVMIGAGSILINCHIDDNTVIKPYSIIEASSVAKQCVIGPFARLRPGSALRDNVHVGNFVEIKKSHLDEGSKVNHLSYIGDCDIGKRVNVGAGVITCNYDGVNKFKTIIEDDAFIGSDCQLIAPVTVQKGATIGAGSTITQMVNENELALTRAPLKTVKNWPRPIKKT